MSQLKNKTYLSIFLIIIFLGIIGFLAFKYIAPFGKISYYHFASKFPGAEEVITFSPGKDSVLKIPSQIIINSKSRLQLKLLSPEVESIKATLKFKPTLNEIILGVRGNEKDNFYYQPFYRDLLYYLNWKKIDEGGFTLWQKEQKYQTISDFINNPPQDKKIALYSVDLGKLQALKSDKSKGEAKTTIGIPLRGSHSLLIRVDKKPLILKIAKQDLNAYEGEDKFKITVLKDEKQLIEKIIEDDGINEVNQLKAEPQEKIITLEDVNPGIYQVYIAYEGNGSDSSITKIEVNQSKVIFKNQVLFLGDKPTEIWTNAKKINAVTAHPQGLQTVKLDGKYDLEIKEKGKQYSFDLESLAGKKEGQGLYKLESPKNDLTIYGVGYFSFSQDTFFLPEMVKGVELNTLENLDNVDYLLTSYPIPKKDGDWLIAEAEFDPKDLKIDGDKLYFSLEVPQIAKYGGELEIDYLEIVVKSKGILEKDQKQPTSTPKLTITPEKLSPTPTATPSGILIRVLNGGAEKGAAAKFAEVLKKAGFSPVEPGNADRTNYKNVTLQFRASDKALEEKIVKLLQIEYKTIETKEIATISAQITIILGEK